MNGPDLRSRPIIEVKDVRKEYPIGDETVVALKRINLNVSRGEICCIFGTSGSGKSTLLNQLAGMEKPTRGEVRIGGVPISRLNENQLAAFRQRHPGFVFQSYNLLPNLTATENVALPLMFRGVPKAQREAAARKLLTRVGLAHRQPGLQNHGGDHGHDLYLRPGLPSDHHSGHPRSGDGLLRPPDRHPHRRRDRKQRSQSKGEISP